MIDEEDFMMVNKDGESNKKSLTKRQEEFHIKKYMLGVSILLICLDMTNAISFFQYEKCSSSPCCTLVKMIGPLASLRLLQILGSFIELSFDLGLFFGVWRNRPSLLFRWLIYYGICASINLIYEFGYLWSRISGTKVWNDQSYNHGPSHLVQFFCMAFLWSFVYEFRMKIFKRSTRIIHRY
nr:uncharacterized protein LOC121121915 [Lepeophtheirus salmonis]